MKASRFLLLVHVQARLDLKAEASKLYLSYLWWIVEPILFVLVFYFIFEILLNQSRDDYLLFLVCGKIPFIWFSKAVSSSSTSLVRNTGIIAQSDIPKIIFPHSAIYAASTKEGPVLLLLLAFLFFAGVEPAPNWFWLVPLVAAQYLLISAAGVLAALLIAFVPDFKHVLGMVITFLLFGSGIFWDVAEIQDEGLRNLYLALNPLAFLLDSYRSILLEGTPINVFHTSVIIFVSLGILLMLHFIYRRYGQTIADALLRS